MTSLRLAVRVCTSTATSCQRGRIRSFNVTSHTSPSAGGHPVIRKHGAETSIFFFFERGHPYSSALSGLRVYVAARGEKSFYKRDCFLFHRRPPVYIRSRVTHNTRRSVGFREHLETYRFPSSSFPSYFFFFFFFSYFFYSDINFNLAVSTRRKVGREYRNYVFTREVCIRATGTVLL